MDLCTKCGNMGILADGTPCNCEYALNKTNVELTSIFIPNEYRNSTFRKEMLPNFEGYQDFMQRLILDCITDKSNTFISAPPKSGKHMVAYTIIQKLFSSKHVTVPLIDIQEAGSALRALDYLKDFKLDFQPQEVLLSKLLLLEYGSEFTYNVSEQFLKIIERRSRRGLRTIVFSDYSWDFICEKDPTNMLKTLKGEGIYGTLKVFDFGYDRREQTNA